MQLFKAFYKIAWKRLPAISIYFIVFVALTFLLGTTSENNLNANFQSKSLDICVIDEDHSAASEGLVNYLDSIHNLFSLENDPEMLQDYLYYRYISYVLTIPEGFEEKLATGETEELLTNVKIPGSSTGYFVDQQVEQYIGNLQLYMAGGYSLTDALTATNETISDASETECLTFQQENTSTNERIFYFYQYLPYIFIVLLICGMAPILVTFNQKDINSRNLCSATSLGSRNFQLAASCILYSLLTWVAFLLFGIAVYGSDMFTEKALYAMLNSFAFLLVAASLAFLASYFVTNDGVANMIANALGLGVAFLCGVFVPQSMLSDQVLAVARFLPAYWYIRSNNMLAGFSTETFESQFYWTSIGIQILFAAAIFTVTLVVSKLQRQKA